MKDISKNFCQAKQTHIDEISSDEHIKMNFVEFQEALVRCCEKANKPTLVLNEKYQEDQFTKKLDWNIAIKTNPFENLKVIKFRKENDTGSLENKIENSIPFLLLACSDKFKEAFQFQQSCRFYEELPNNIKLVSLNTLQFFKQLKYKPKVIQELIRKMQEKSQQEFQQPVESEIQKIYQRMRRVNVKVTNTKLLGQFLLKGITQNILPEINQPKNFLSNATTSTKPSSQRKKFRRQSVQNPLDKPPFIAHNRNETSKQGEESPSSEFYSQDHSRSESNSSNSGSQYSKEDYELE